MPEGVNMRFRAFMAAVVAGLLLLLTPVSLAAGPYPPPNDEHGEVDDTRVEAGACVIFSGGGFLPGTQVEITDNGEVIGFATVDDQGEFRHEVCFGAGAGRGRHTLAASGIGADGSVLEVTATVFVTGVSQLPRPGTGPGRGGSAGGATGGEPGTATPGATGAPTPAGSSGVPSVEPTSSEAPGVQKPPSQANRDSAGMGLAGWLIVLGLFAFLALLSLLVLLAGRRRRDDDAAAPV